MQTSLRANNYQYYDYGSSLNCATRHRLEPPDGLIAANHNHILDLPLQSPPTAATNHQIEGIIDTFDQQQQQQQPQSTGATNHLYSTCYNERLRVEIASSEHQLIVYDEQQHQYQLLGQTHQQDHQPHHNNHNSHDHQHHQQLNQLQHNGASDSGNNIYLPQQQQTASLLSGCEQTTFVVAQPQTSAYRTTIYYEPIGFSESCALEAPQQGADARQQQKPQRHPQQVQQLFQQPRHELINGFPISQQQEALADNACATTYFHHRGGIENKLQRCHQQVANLSHINDQQQQAHQDQSLGEAQCQDQRQFSYQTLEPTSVSTSSTFELSNRQGFAASQEQQQYEFLHQQHQLDSSNKVDNNYQHHLQQQQAMCCQGAESAGNSLANSTQESLSSATSTSSSASSDGSEEFSADECSTASSTLTRDEKRAREANIPLSYSEIVNLSIDQFNEQLAKHNLSESQLTLIKDIRRRGKNKVAAQSCRKRKMEQIHELQHEVSNLVNKRRALGCEYAQLVKEHGNLVQEYDRIYAIIQDRMLLD